MKRAFSIFLIFVLCFALVGCEGDAGNVAATTAPTQAAVAVQIDAASAIESYLGSFAVK